MVYLELIIERINCLPMNFFGGKEDPNALVENFVGYFLKQLLDSGKIDTPVEICCLSWPIDFFSNVSLQIAHLKSHNSQRKEISVELAQC
jgi:hypothetical protein